MKSEFLLYIYMSFEKKVKKSFEKNVNIYTRACNNSLLVMYSRAYLLIQIS
jgi:hypothetical protein